MQFINTIKKKNYQVISKFLTSKSRPWRDEGKMCILEFARVWRRLVNIIIQTHWTMTSCFYLFAELPQAPCLSVRMFTIFWMSCVAVTWSRYLAARIRWSHIFSSSRFSAAYWAQLDCGGQKAERSITQPARRKYFSAQNKCAKGQNRRKIDCKMWNVGVLTLRYPKKIGVKVKAAPEVAVFPHRNFKWKARGSFLSLRQVD